MIPVGPTVTASLLKTVAAGNSMKGSSDKQVQRSFHPYVTTSATKWPLKGRKMGKRRHFVTADLSSGSI